MKQVEEHSGVWKQGMQMASGANLPGSVGTEARTSAATLIKSQGESELLPFADFCERNDMLQRHNHQGNCGPAPGTSDPDNLSGLHQQLTSHLHQAQQKSSVRLILFAFTPRPAPREQLLSRGKGKVA